MRTLHTAASRPYDIVIGPGLLKEAGERSRRINRGVRVLLVSDSNVAPCMPTPWLRATPPRDIA